MTAPLTLHSLDDLHTHIRPTSPAECLRHLIINTLRRKGFEAAESGTIAELERLLEHHIQSLFESANEYASLSGRTHPHAGDALAAQDEVLNSRSLKRESKKRRKAVHLPIDPGPSSPPPKTTLDLLVDFASEIPIQSHLPLDDTDRKPDLDDLQRTTSNSGAGPSRKGEVPSYAFDWAPGLPPKWMYDTPHINPWETPRVPEVEPPPKVTSASMDFVKFTTVVGENIPPELGIVHFLKTGDRTKKRRMGGMSGS